MADNEFQQTIDELVDSINAGVDRIIDQRDFYRDRLQEIAETDPDLVDPDHLITMAELALEDGAPAKHTPQVGEVTPPENAEDIN